MKPILPSYKCPSGRSAHKQAYTGNPHNHTHPVIWEFTLSEVLGFVVEGIHRSGAVPAGTAYLFGLDQFRG